MSFLNADYSSDHVFPSGDPFLCKPVGRGGRWSVYLVSAVVLFAIQA